jgi:hypothetical protein
MACAVAARPSGTLCASNLMQARCSRAKVSPCSGWMRRSAVTSAVTAAMLQRTRRPRREPYRPSWAQCPQKRPGPMNKNTTTSAATETDQRRLVLIAVSPAALQRMTEKVSCIAWLPSTSAATSTTRRKTALPSNVRRFSRVTSSTAGLMVIFARRAQAWQQRVAPSAESPGAKECSQLRSTQLFCRLRGTPL